MRGNVQPLAPLPRPSPKTTRRWIGRSKSLQRHRRDHAEIDPKAGCAFTVHTHSPVGCRRAGRRGPGRKAVVSPTTLLAYSCHFTVWANPLLSTLRAARPAMPSMRFHFSRLLGSEQDRRRCASRTGSANAMPKSVTARVSPVDEADPPAFVVLPRNRHEWPGRDTPEVVISVLGGE
jgi:hypothetical protein